MHEDEPFLKRWSRRKLATRHDAARAPSAPSGEALAPPPTQAATPAPTEVGGTRRDAPLAGEGGADAPAAEAFADVDFEALDFQSDYARFLAPGVPDPIRHKALRKLWASHPIFTAADPYQDYQGDYTDAALAVPAGALKTAYRVGRGFLSDADVAQLDGRGPGAEGARPAAAPLAAAAGGPVTIAAPEAADRAELAALLRNADADAAAACCPGAAAAVLERADARLLVARTAAALVGVGALTCAGDATGRIAVLFVAREARRAHIGTRILASLEEEARTQGVRMIRVAAGARRNDALALLQRQGYRQRPAPAGDRQDTAIVFEKPL
jgi:GNAT superfamily N-acetyltransferase